ncbi:MAG TPA: hypothetical protein VD902_03185 [Symbiobacteriaceae bacterium]|nr:hypothetical protein [Symbiobacteriaceae bacterium]
MLSLSDQWKEPTTLAIGFSVHGVSMGLGAWLVAKAAAVKRQLSA